MRSTRVKESFEALQKDVKAFRMLRDKMVQELAVKFRKKEGRFLPGIADAVQ